MKTIVSHEFYVEKLNDCFRARQHKNKSYSLRAYARDLGLHPSTLSAVLHKKRGLPWSQGIMICEKLRLKKNERHSFLKSLHQQKFWQFPKTLDFLNSKTTLSESSYFKVIAEWEYFAVLTLFDTTGFKGTVMNITENLGISKSRVLEVISILVQLNLLTDQGGQFKKNPQGSFKTTEDILSKALQLAHLQELELAKQKLAITPVDLRDYSSNCMAINRAQLPKAKQLIREFRKNMEALLEKGCRKDVYLLSIQLFPLSERSKTNSSKTKKRTEHEI